MTRNPNISFRLLPNPNSKIDTSYSKLLENSLEEPNPSENCHINTLTHTERIHTERTHPKIHPNNQSSLAKSLRAYLAKVSRLAVMIMLLMSCSSCAAKLHASTDESITGKTELSFEQIAAFILDTNPNFDTEIARHYVNIGKKYGIRAEIAISQAILETGWFEFKHSKTVKSHHHNYCGLGVTSSTTQGCCFDRIDDGVKAHIQHLFAYATNKPLPKGETLIDPRFKYVKRACAPSLSGLTGTWAMSNQYSKQILDIYLRMQEFIKKSYPEANQ